MRTYKVEVEITSLRLVDDEKVEPVVAVLQSWGMYDFDDANIDLLGDVTCFAGYRDLGGGRTPDDAHPVLAEKLEGYSVVTRWRCVDYDEWDEVIGETAEEDK